MSHDTRSDVISKSDLAAITTVLACVVWLDHGQHVFTDAASSTELSVAAAACPENDTMPYNARCLAFLEGSDSARTWRAGPAVAVVRYAPADAGRAYGFPGGGCPVNDNMPYSASCLRFLSGLQWQPYVAAAPVERVAPRSFQ